ncbi:response regulator [Candidatus Woesearchaeota archaeon]|nr:response regulator [Candidatus Woesearchaeota archaeon]
MKEKIKKRKKKIMVVDDEIDIRQAVKKVLEKSGFKVITAVNVKDCLIKLKKVKPDLILLDIIMGGIPAYKLAEVVKDVKICFLTGVASLSNKEKALIKKKKVVGFISKPVSIKELISKVKSLTSFKN